MPSRFIPTRNPAASNRRAASRRQTWTWESYPSWASIRPAPLPWMRSGSGRPTQTWCPPIATLTACTTPTTFNTTIPMGATTIGMIDDPSLVELVSIARHHLDHVDRGVAEDLHAEGLAWTLAPEG